MAGKFNAEHVVHFALQPVGRGPDAHHAGRGFAIADLRLDAQALPLGERIKDQHHVKALLALGPIHRRQIGEQVELLLVARVLRDFQQLIGRDDQDGLLAVSPGFANGLAEAGSVALHQFVVQRDGAFLRRRRRRFRRRGGRGRLCNSGRTTRAFSSLGRGGRLLFFRFVGHESGRHPAQTERTGTENRTVVSSTRLKTTSTTSPNKLQPQSAAPDAVAGRGTSRARAKKSPAARGCRGDGEICMRGAYTHSRARFRNSQM